MTQGQIKIAVKDTLQKVDRQDLPAVIRQIRLKALMLAMFNNLSEETLTAINEACAEFEVQK